MTGPPQSCLSFLSHFWQAVEEERGWPGASKSSTSQHSEFARHLCCEILTGRCALWIFLNILNSLLSVTAKACQASFWPSSDAIRVSPLPGWAAAGRLKCQVPPVLNSALVRGRGQAEARSVQP